MFSAPMSEVAGWSATNLKEGADATADRQNRNLQPADVFSKGAARYDAAVAAAKLRLEVLAGYINTHVTEASLPAARRAMGDVLRRVGQFSTIADVEHTGLSMLIANGLGLRFSGEMQEAAVRKELSAAQVVDAVILAFEERVDGKAAVDGMAECYVMQRVLTNISEQLATKQPPREPPPAPERAPMAIEDLVAESGMVPLDNTGLAMVDAAKEWLKVHKPLQAAAIPAKVHAAAPHFTAALCAGLPPPGTAHPAAEGAVVLADTYIQTLKFDTMHHSMEALSESEWWRAPPGGIGSQSAAALVTVTSSAGQRAVQPIWMALARGGARDASQAETAVRTAHLIVGTDNNPYMQEFHARLGVVRIVGGERIYSSFSEVCAIGVPLMRAEFLDGNAPRGIIQTVRRKMLAIAHELHMPDGSGAGTVGKAIEGNVSEKVYMGAISGLLTYVEKAAPRNQMQQTNLLVKMAAFSAITAQFPFTQALADEAIERIRRLESAASGMGHGPLSLLPAYAAKPALKAAYEAAFAQDKLEFGGTPPAAPAKSAPRAASMAGSSPPVSRYALPDLSTLDDAALLRHVRGSVPQLELGGSYTKDKCNGCASTLCTAKWLRDCPQVQHYVAAIEVARQRGLRVAPFDYYTLPDNRHIRPGETVEGFRGRIRDEDEAEERRNRTRDAQAERERYNRSQGDGRDRGHGGGWGDDATSFTGGSSISRPGPGHQAGARGSVHGARSDHGGGPGSAHGGSRRGGGGGGHGRWGGEGERHAASNSGGRPRPDNRACHNCGRSGHLQAECTLPANPVQRGRSRSRSRSRPGADAASRAGSGAGAATGTSDKGSAAGGK